MDTEREPRADKVAVVSEVRERLDGSSAVLVTEYRGLDVPAMAELRRSLRAVGGEYKIYKNTLVRLAVADLGVADLDDLLVGPTALTFVDDDAAAVAKALRDFARDHEALVIKGGVLGSDFLDEAQIVALADLPSRDVLLARLAGGLQAPMQKFAGLLQGTVAKFAYALSALVEAGGAPGAPTPEAGSSEPEPEPAVEVEASADDTSGEPAVEASADDTSEEPAVEASADDTSEEPPPADQD